MTRDSLHSKARLLRGRLVTAGIIGGVHALGSLRALLPSSEPLRKGLELVRDLPYVEGARPQQRLDVWRPLSGGSSSDALRPVVLYLHGGGFHALSKETHDAFASRWAQQGFVVFNANYRLAPREPFPAAVQDAASAWLWVSKWAREHGGDPERVVLAGESAGANLVTVVAMLGALWRPEPWARPVWECAHRPRAVIASCGVFEISDPLGLARRGTWPPFMADHFFEVSRDYLPPGIVHSPSALDLADPLRTLEKTRELDRELPPFLLTVGTRDPLLSDTQRMKIALDRLLVPCRARYHVGSGHAFFAHPWSLPSRRYWEECRAFLEDIL